MEAALQRETNAFAFGEEEFSDVELVFVQEQPPLAEQEEVAPLQQQKKTTMRGKATKRRHEGRI